MVGMINRHSLVVIVQLDRLSVSPFSLNSYSFLFVNELFVEHVTS